GDNSANTAANTEIVVINPVDGETIRSLAESAAYCAFPRNSDRWGGYIRSKKGQVVRILRDRQILKLPRLKCHCNLRGIRLDDVFNPTGNVDDRSACGDRERYVGRHC